MLLLRLMWWMYGGYAWLTNAAPPVTAFRRGCLLLGMVGNFVMALAIPHAFTTDRLVFALATCWWRPCLPACTSASRRGSRSR